MTSADHQHEHARTDGAAAGSDAGQAADVTAGGAPQEAAAPGPGVEGQRAFAQTVAGAEASAEDPGVGAVDDLASVSSTELLADLAKAQQDVATLTTDLQRLQAEYVNYKRRVDRDRELVRQTATYAVLSALLPVLDDIDRAREHGEVEGGFKAVADSLERAVAGLGLEKFGEPGDEFDPNLHEALMHAHSPDVTTTTCQTIVQAGYRMGDRVMRAARVTVVDPAPESPPGDAGVSGDASGARPTTPEPGKPETGNPRPGA